MTAAQLERLQEHLQRLRLFKSRDRLEALLQEATGKELSYADFLDQVLTEEVASKTAKHVTMHPPSRHHPQHPGQLVPSNDRAWGSLAAR